MTKWVKDKRDGTQLYLSRELVHKDLIESNDIALILQFLGGWERAEKTGG